MAEIEAVNTGANGGAGDTASRVHPDGDGGVSTSEAVGPDTADRDCLGRFVPGNAAGASPRFQDGNRAALRHGVRAFEARGDAALAPDLRVSIEDFRAAVIEDRGGITNLTAIEAGYISKLTDVEVMCRLLMADLRSRGVFTAKGRVRGTFTKLLEVMDRWDRYATRVGTDRRARPVTFAQQVREAGRE